MGVCAGGELETGSDAVTAAASPTAEPLKIGRREARGVDVAPKGGAPSTNQELERAHAYCSGAAIRSKASEQNLGSHGSLTACG
eukprot:scaffold173075_cov33-Tisochrysis_lutea.AAC.1